jgi:hypothetical protein
VPSSQTRIAHGERLYGHVEEGCTNHALFDFTCSCQASAEHFQQCAEFLLLCNRGLRALAVTVLPIALARRAAGTRMPDQAASSEQFDAQQRLYRPWV